MTTLELVETIELGFDLNKLTSSTKKLKNSILIPTDTIETGDDMFGLFHFKGQNMEKDWWKGVLSDLPESFGLAW